MSEVTVERRGFLQAVLGGATVHADPAMRRTKRKDGSSARGHHADNERLYHGPFFVPADVAEAIREDGSLYRTARRPQYDVTGEVKRECGGKLASRYVDGDGCTWVGKCPIPESRTVVGEIVRTGEGRIRVHWWAAATPGTARRDAREIASRRAETLPEPARSSEPIMPPLASEYSHYLDPRYAEQLMAEPLPDETLPAEAR